MPKRGPHRPVAHKTDTKDLNLKVKARLWALSRLGRPGPYRVLDLCAGEGLVWAEMRRHVAVSAYTPCDREPRLPGTIKGEAERLAQAFDLSRFDAIDIDVYGDPWATWQALLPRLAQPTAVFLTHGLVGGKGATGGVGLSNAARDALGIPRDWRLPPGLKALAAFAGEYILRDSVRRARLLAVGRLRLPRVIYYSLVVAPPEAGPGEGRVP